VGRPHFVRAPSEAGPVTPVRAAWATRDAGTLTQASGRPCESFMRLMATTKNEAAGTSSPVTQPSRPDHRPTGQDTAERGGLRHHTRRWCLSRCVKKELRV